MNDQIRTFIYLMSLGIFVILFSLTILSFYFISQEDVPLFLSFFVKYHVAFMFVVAISALMFGAISQIYLNRTLIRNKTENKEAFRSFLQLLNEEEKRIILFLLDNNYSCTQYELSKMENMNKIKVHRSLEKLARRGIIRKQNLGKINKVYLEEKFRI